MENWQGFGADNLKFFKNAHLNIFEENCWKKLTKFVRAFRKSEIHTVYMYKKEKERAERTRTEFAKQFKGWPLSHIEIGLFNSLYDFQAQHN